MTDKLKKAIDEARANYNTSNIDQHYEMRCDRCVKRQKELDDTVISIALAELEKKNKEIEDLRVVDTTEGCSLCMMAKDNRIAQLEQAIDKAVEQMSKGTGMSDWEAKFDEVEDILTQAKEDK